MKASKLNAKEPVLEGGMDGLGALFARSLAFNQLALLGRSTSIWALLG
jgi:hypothetical protein